MLNVTAESDFPRRNPSRTPLQIPIVAAIPNIRHRRFFRRSKTGPRPRRRTRITLQVKRSITKLTNLTIHWRFSFAYKTPLLWKYYSISDNANSVKNWQNIKGSKV